MSDPLSEFTPNFSPKREARKTTYTALVLVAIFLVLIYVAYMLVIWLLSI